MCYDCEWFACFACFDRLRWFLCNHIMKKEKLSHHSWVFACFSTRTFALDELGKKTPLTLTHTDIRVHISHKYWNVQTVFRIILEAIYIHEYFSIKIAFYSMLASNQWRQQLLAEEKKRQRPRTLRVTIPEKYATWCQTNNSHTLNPDHTHSILLSLFRAHSRTDMPVSVRVYEIGWFSPSWSSWLQSF